jgi:hypothetical protein
MISASGWLLKKKSIPMNGNMNVKEIHVDFSLKKMLGKCIVKLPYLCYSKTQHVLYLYAAKHSKSALFAVCLFGLYKGILVC